MIKRLFSPPVFNKEEDNLRARFINGFAWILNLILALGIITSTPGEYVTIQRGSTVIVLAGLILVMFLSLYMLHRGNLNVSGGIIIVLGWLGLSYQAYSADGVRDVVIIAYIAISLLASIIINWRAGGAVMIISIAAVWILTFLEVSGRLVPAFQEPIPFSRDLTLVLLAISILIYFSTNSMQEAIIRAKKSEKNLLESNKDLQELNQSLEERVTLRTADLDTANRFNAQRARQFEAIAQVVRAISSIQDLDALLPKITQVVSEQFKTYHTGIFLVDAAREYAILRAANSVGGKIMLDRSHRLQVGQTGLVGFVTATGQPRIALDVGSDAVFFNNPDLPDTRSEITLPLRYGGLVIGALDVQSKESNAFGQDDVEALVTLADQIAVAINNTIILEEARKAFVESQNRFGQTTLESWKVMRPKSLGLGFQLIDSAVQPLEKALEGAHIQEAIDQEKPILSGSENKISSLAIPIRLRGQVIGIMNLQSRNEYPLTQDDADIAEAVSERLSLAIETATLLQTTQHRADIERVTTDISSRISASTRFDTILQTAAQELSRALGGSDVIVQIEPAAIALGMDR